MKVMRLVGAIFAGVGTIFLIAAAVIHLKTARFLDDAEAVTGQVIELVPSWSRSDSGRRSSSPTYAARVAFVDAGGQPREFVESSSSNPPRHAVGDRVAIRYDRAAPSNAVIDDFWGRHGLVVIMGPMGLIFAIVGGVLFGISVRNRRRSARLRQVGRPIEAEFLHVILDESVSYNGRHPFRVVAQANAPDTGLLRRFESEALSVDPTARLEGGKVRVLIDPDGGDDYLIDLTSIVDDRDRF